MSSLCLLQILCTENVAYASAAYELPHAVRSKLIAKNEKAMRGYKVRGMRYLDGKGR